MSVIPVIPVLPEEHEFTRMETRELPPAHFMIKIESSLFEPSRTDKYETKEFVAGECKWSLIIYPNGDNSVEKDSGYISVYLAMANTSSNWEVYAVFTIFLYNHISGKYLSSLGRTRRFRGMKSQWGFSKFISKASLKDPSNGYVVDDNCVFGAEVFVVKREALNQCLSLKDSDIPYKRDWKIPNFSKLEEIYWTSEEFTAGGRKWRIHLYPKGNGRGAGSHVGIFLKYLGSERVQANYTLIIKNQVSDQHKKGTITDHLFITTANAHGWQEFMEIAIMNDPEKGYIVNDSCLIHVEISSLKSDVTQ
ncbi:hypothetical protein ABFX02_07G096700 [Erythranthe guttata]